MPTSCDKPQDDALIHHDASLQSLASCAQVVVYGDSVRKDEDFPRSVCTQNGVHTERGRRKERK